MYIINHADDQYVFLDPDFVPLVEGLASECPAVKGWIVLTSEEHMPETSLANVHCYETLLAVGQSNSSGRNWMRTPPVPCVIPPAPPATPRVCCIRTALPCCMPTPP